MSEPTRAWKYLERRPGSFYQQLYVKGTRIRAEIVYGNAVDGREPSEYLTPEEVASDLSLPLEAVIEAIEYCKADPPEIREDHRREEESIEAAGMNVYPYQNRGGGLPIAARKQVEQKP